MAFEKKVFSKTVRAARTEGYDAIPEVMILDQVIIVYKVSERGQTVSREALRCETQPHGASLTHSLCILALRCLLLFLFLVASVRP